MEKVIPNKIGYSFDDVLVQPRYSEVTPDQPDLTVCSESRIKMKIPVFSAAMDKVTEYEMAKAMYELGGIGIIHKNWSIEKQVEVVTRLKAEGVTQIACAVGVNDDKDGRIEKLVKAGATFLHVATAHGHSLNVSNIIKHIKNNYDVLLSAGNVSTYDGAKFLMEHDIDAVMVGIGPGSICTTRIKTGCGTPQITAIADARRAQRSIGKNRVMIVGDGGIKNSGDLVKALVAEAHAGVLGNVLSTTDEAPGRRIVRDGKHYKEYRGMGSIEAMNTKGGSGDRYFRTSETAKTSAEGISAWVECTGSVDKIMDDFLGSVKSAMGYLGCSKLSQLHECQFMEITASGMNESKPHSIHYFNPTEE